MIDARSVSVGDVVRLSEDAGVADDYKGCYCIVAEIEHDDYDVLRVEVPTTRRLHNYGKDCLLTHYDGTEAFKSWVSCRHFDPDVYSFPTFGENPELDELFGEMG